MNKVKEIIKNFVKLIGDIFENYIDLDNEDKFNNKKEKEEN